MSKVKEIGSLSQTAKRHDINNERAEELGAAAERIANTYDLADSGRLGRLMGTYHASQQSFANEVIADNGRTECAMALFSVAHKAANELLHLDSLQHLTVRIVGSDDRRKVFKVLAGIWEVGTTPPRSTALPTHQYVSAELIESLCEYWTSSGKNFPDMRGLNEDNLTQEVAYTEDRQMFAFVREVVASCGWFVERGWLWCQLMIYYFEHILPKTEEECERQ